jgi:hypothetical protein
MQFTDSQTALLVPDIVISALVFLPPWDPEMKEVSIWHSSGRVAYGCLVLGPLTPTGLLCCLEVHCVGSGDFRRPPDHWPLPCVLIKSGPQSPFWLPASQEGLLNTSVPVFCWETEVWNQLLQLQSWWALNKSTGEDQSWRLNFQSLTETFHQYLSGVETPPLWVSLMLDEISQTQKDSYRMIPGP